MNELWQIDGLVYRLFDHDHTQITVYQVIDDARRFDVDTQAFPTAENGNDARLVLAAAFDTYGLPQEILSDNGDAFATYHRGRLSSTELWLAQKGVVAIAGFAPTTQGKDERSHKTLTRFLDARQPTTLAHVQQLLTQFHQFYNTQRRHQSLVCGKDAHHVGCGLLVPVFQERGTGLFRVVGTGPGQASSMRCPTRTKCCALTRRGLPGR